jgi:hypothetical protein
MRWLFADGSEADRQYASEVAGKLFLDAWHRLIQKKINANQSA